jgi:Ca2+-binding RTX toxin-like protein
VRNPLLTSALLLAVTVPVEAASAKTSQEGWPLITGSLRINHHDRNVVWNGTSRNDKLLGGHGNDTLRGGRGHDVIWGDHKPGRGNGPRQTDRLFGGPGNDWIFASHGRNIIHGGPGNDRIRVWFGRGSVDCGSGYDILFISRRGLRAKRYKIRNCERISHHTIGR